MKRVSKGVSIALADMDEALQNLASEWAASPHRPRPPEAALAAWDDLIEGWIKSDLPLLCRTPNWGRGAKDVHISGRALTCADNTPAHWAFSLALTGETPGLTEIRDNFTQGLMPLAFAIKATEKDRAVYTRGGLSSKLRLNRDGWKVCHIASAGLRTVGHPAGQPLEVIEAHFRRFMSPRNMFLVPLTLGGLGETPQMIAAIKRYDSVPDYR